MESTRADRWLWAIRLYKTRAAAADACKAGHVSINGKKAKPAAQVRVGDRLEARVNQRQRTVEVLRVIESRVGAPIAVECYVDHSLPPDPRPSAAALAGSRDPGSGRPTKRDRRRMERLRGKSKGR
ncbi:RNA-binding S4 domain-containing protein [Euzebya pacifica]|uniref:RNA-binding S4 domain-containing protein n=1 Tax=Euzebya pacifica TaxID=1608957 RepID=UPI0030F605F6